MEWIKKQLPLILTALLAGGAGTGGTVMYRQEQTINQQQEHLENVQLRTRVRELERSIQQNAHEMAIRIEDLDQCRDDLVEARALLKVAQDEASSPPSRPAHTGSDRGPAPAPPSRMP